MTKQNIEERIKKLEEEKSRLTEQMYRQSRDLLKEMLARGTQKDLEGYLEEYNIANYRRTSSNGAYDDYSLSIKGKRLQIKRMIVPYGCL